MVDEGKVSISENEENSILANLLLTSDIKGDVEQPNYYFTSINDEAHSNLDLVMLTHGYRRFDWKPLLNNTYPALAYQPEKSLEIAGTAKMFIGRAVSKGTVSLIAPFSGHGVLSTITDDKGNFRFTNLVYMDTVKFILQAVNAKGSNNTVLTYIGDKPVPVAPYLQPQVTRADTGLNVYMKNNKMLRDRLYAKGLITGKMLKEVKINARKLTPVVNDTRYGVADKVIDGADIEYGGFLADRLIPKMTGIKFVIGRNFEAHAYLNRPSFGPMLVILDGVEMPGFDLNSLNTGSIDKIEVIKDYALNGALVITTVKGVPLRDITSKGILPITAKGFYKAREFYSPKYEKCGHQ